jgi:pimeloyl-ACP methyl ester carboxylesterase
LIDLTRYEITPLSTDMIEDAGVWTLSQPDLAPDGRAGFMGISFGGGLTLAAAGRPSIADRAAFAFSFGGHGDLPRVLRYLCTGNLPDGTRLPPHDYGVAVILLGAADRVVPPEQVGPLKAGILTFLNASLLDMVDRTRAAEAFARARALEHELPEPAASFMRDVNTRNVASLGPKLLPHAGALGRDPALSPERSAPPRSPVYLLHGTDDNVIPAAESRLLADKLRPVTAVHFLASPLITHAELDKPAPVMDILRLVGFWGRLLSE